MSEEPLMPTSWTAGTRAGVVSEAKADMVLDFWCSLSRSRQGSLLKRLASKFFMKEVTDIRLTSGSTIAEAVTLPSTFTAASGIEIHRDDEPKKPAICSTCSFFRRNSTSSSGLCRRYPPTDEGSPGVSDDWTCGEWKEKS